MVLIEGGDPADQPPGKDAWSAPIRYWIPALEYLARFGINIELTSLRDHTPLQDEAKARGWTVSNLGAESSWDYPVAAARLRRLIGEKEIAIVHASESIQAAVAGIATFRTLTKCLFHRHHVKAIGPQWMFTRIANRTSNLIMPVSEAAGRQSIKEGVPPEKIFVAHNGIAPLREVTNEEVNVLRQQLGLRSDQPIVMVVGRQRPEKGHELVILASHLIARTQPEAAIVFVGEGPRHEYLKALSRSASLPVFLVGHKSDIAQWFQLATVLVIPSIRESFGLTAIEAMSCGIPVIAARTEGLPEVVADGETGLMFTPGDEQGLANAVSELLRNPQRAIALGQAGRQRFLEKFSLEAMVKSWMSGYSLIVDLQD